MGEKITVYTQQTLLSPPQFRLSSRSFSVAIADTNLLQFDSITNLSVLSSPPRIQLDHSASIAEANRSYSSRSQRLENAVGTTDFRVFDTDANLACIEPEKVARVRVGCPPGRHIRVRKPPLSSCQIDEGHSYTVAEKAHVFDRKRFGCPIAVFHQVSNLSIMCRISHHIISLYFLCVCGLADEWLSSNCGSV